MASREELDNIEKSLKLVQAYAARVSISASGGPSLGLRPIACNLTQVTVAWEGGQSKFQIDDEYEDAKADNAPLCLALIRMMIEDMRDAANASSWAQAISWHGSKIEIGEIYTHNLANYKKMADALGEIPDLVSPLDWQLNSGLAAILRKNKS